MSKVSTNAGKHPYLRTDEEEYRNLFSHLKTESGGIPILKIKTPLFKVEAETEFFDKNNQSIWFGDSLKFQNDEYVVKFQNRKWIMVNIKDSKKVEILKEKAHLTVLLKN